ncbi:unnamed protein product [Polarella glacialis]|uniref:Poly [ADP-ribose] polymerase n=1 Tax=Polarella glacialis TaxID=89957 RepID=A0A813H912_POLGL|nr:unnamed protein product [Polarella glacialis]
MTTMVGTTPEFMAPEFPESSTASDVFSLGVVCARLLDCWEQRFGQELKDERNLLRDVTGRMQSRDKDARPTAVESLEEVTKILSAAQASSDRSQPSYWQQLPGQPSAKVPVARDEILHWPAGQTTWGQFSAALKQTMHDSCRQHQFGDCSPSVRSVERLENPMLWQRYCVARERMASSGLASPINPPVRLENPVIDSSCNEYWLWHGTRHHNVEAILKEGLDEHLSLLDGLYGAGIYFSDEACKALQYSDANGPRYLLLCRVLLGRPYYTRNILKTLRSPKNLPERGDLLQRPEAAGHDSVIVNAGPIQGHPNPNGQVHREFVIFDGACAYPEFVVSVDKV